MTIDRPGNPDRSGKPRFEDLMNNPEKYFKHPDEVLASTEFTLTQKIALLKQWQNDLSLRHEAETEGMDRPEHARKQLLPAITDALILLGETTTHGSRKQT